MICPICGIDSRKLPLTAVHRHALPELTPELLALLKEPFVMAGPVTSCEHVKKGAPTAGTFQLPIPLGEHERLAPGMSPTMTVTVCANCLAQGSGGGASTIKGGYSIGSTANYFGSKVDK